MRSIFSLRTLIVAGAFEILCFTAFAAPIRINCGGPVYNDTAGYNWLADTYFSGGTPNDYGSKPVSGTNDPTLYQTERFGRALSYDVPVTNGNYTVTLDFAEMYFTAPGRRVFDVAIEGQTVLSNFDIYATAGAQTAVQRSFAVSVTDGTLNIAGSASVNNAKFSAIEVVLNATPTPTPTATPVRVNCGGPAYSDSAGDDWLADIYYSGGKPLDFGSAPVTGTNDPTLYQTERFGRTLSYNVPVTNGSYTVTLDFAEMYFTAPGQRIFSVAIEGQTLLSNFDIYAVAGAQTAVQRSFVVNVTDGALNIVGTATVNNAKFSAFEVIQKGGATPTPTPTATPTPTPIAFRIAISEDGNWHDRDDICSAAVAIAQLASTGNQSHLVHYDYADHYWLTDATREGEMKISTVDSANVWGGFDMSVFYNATQSRAPAISHLTAEINKSSASSPLKILAFGPMEVIGLAVAQSDPTKRQYVTLISHSVWNDNHAFDSGPKEGLQETPYKYSMIGSMGVKLDHIVDQNAGLSRPYSEYYWLRDSPDSRLKWVWSRGQAAAKSTFDCSDAGEIYYIVTGDQHCNPLKLKTLLTGQ